MSKKPQKADEKDAGASKAPAPNTEALDAIDKYVDNRVGAEWSPADVTEVAKHAMKLPDGGEISSYVATRAQSMWTQEMANNVHALVAKRR